MCLEKFCEKVRNFHKTEINCLLHIIAIIVFVYALWIHSIELILVAILIAIIGHITQEVKFKLDKRIKNSKRRKKGALELSIGTIVVIVIAITMLILGIVFVRSVMCGAMGLTGELNSKVKGEINKLFGSTGGEVQCLGQSSEPVKIIPGKTSNIWCGIKAPQTAKYSITLVDYNGIYSSKSEIKKWITIDSWTGTVAPGDDVPKKVIMLNVPENAPEDTIRLKIVIKKEGTIIAERDLDFKISRSGFFRAAMC